MVGKTQFSSKDYDKARKTYRPSRIRLLLVAESPPSSGGFFYFTETIGKDHLFRETMKALKLWPVSKPMPKGLDKEPLLRKFQAKGFFLVDTCPLPVDKLSQKDRRAAVTRNSASLAKTVKDLDPTGVTIVKKTVYRSVRSALENIGLESKILNTDPIPFPSHGNQKRYRMQLRRTIKRSETSLDL